MRALWAFVVVCLMAASGVAPARAAAMARELRAEHGELAMRAGQPELPAVTSAHGARLALATRARASLSDLPPAIAPIALKLLRPVAARVVVAIQRAAPPPGVPISIRSARGPPAR